MNPLTRRHFLGQTGMALAGAALAQAQVSGDRPVRTADIRVENPRNRVPVGLIIDDSTCLVNTNKFAMPQFDEAFGHGADVYKRDWREWPNEIPDAFVRKFAEWCFSRGVKGKYSIVPYPACVGRLDRMLPGWTRKELTESIDLVRTAMMPNWDIHPEMITHTRVIDLKTGHPFEDHSLKFMENWEWTTGRSAEEIAEYMAYALQILKNVGLTCEGLTTPGGFGNKALPQLAQATAMAVRGVFGAEIPHYFRHLYAEGPESVAPRVEYASGLDGADPRCVVSIIGCTGDWTGGWDNTTPGGVDKFITPDLQAGRMVEVIQRGEPALMLAHWTGMFWNGKELGFGIFREVVDRLEARFKNLIWMKLSEVARYWAARELTGIEGGGGDIRMRAPYACPEFTLSLPRVPSARPTVEAGGAKVELVEVARESMLRSGTWCAHGERAFVCLDLKRGMNVLKTGA